MYQNYCVSLGRRVKELIIIIKKYKNTLKYLWKMKLKDKFTLLPKLKFMSFFHNTNFHEFF